MKKDSLNILDTLDEKDRMLAERTIQVYKGLPQSFVRKSLDNPLLQFSVGDEPFFKATRAILLGKSDSTNTA